MEEQYLAYQGPAATVVEFPVPKNQIAERIYFLDTPKGFFSMRIEKFAIDLLYTHLISIYPSSAKRPDPFQPDTWDEQFSELLFEIKFFIPFRDIPKEFLEKFIELIATGTLPIPYAHQDANEIRKGWARGLDYLLGRFCGITWGKEISH